MNYKKLCMELISAESEKEVTAVLKSYSEFDVEENWHTYGGVENNFGLISNQQSDALGALTEKIINSTDAVLVKSCLERGIDPEGVEAPKSVREASEQFFGVPDGNISKIGNQSEKNLIGSNIYLVASGSRTSPAIAVIDRGEGQRPENFAKTFLSLQAANKIKIPFVQGRFNMGGTGSLMFCGKENYQLIVSRRNPDLEGKSNNPWGFTIIKKRAPREGERSPSFVYFAPEGNIPHFTAKSLSLLPSPQNPREGSLEGGTYIKMYDYKGIPSTIITTSLYRRMNLRLFYMPLPVTMYEARDYESRTPYVLLEGMRTRLENRKYRKEVLESESYPISTSVRVSGGNHANIKIWLLKQDITKSRWLRPMEAINFTVNGQTHASWDRRFFARKGVKKDYLKNNLLVEVDCSDFSPDLLSEVFMASRDRMRDTIETSEMETAIEKALREDPVLTAYNQKWRENQVRTSYESTKNTEDILKNLMAISPEIAKLLGKEGTLPDPFERGKMREPFIGEDVPTYFDLVSPDSGYLEVPINTFRKLVFKTDAGNQYLSEGLGKVKVSKPDWVKSFSLRDGIFMMEIEPPPKTKVGTETPLNVTISGGGVNFKHKITVKVLEAKETRVSTVDRKEKKKTDTLTIPLIQGIQKKDWKLFGWDQSSVAEVHTHEMGTDIFVNLDNEHLLRNLLDSDFKTRKTEVENIFRIGIGLIAFALKNNLPDTTEESLFNMVLETLAMAWIPTVLKLTRVL